MQNAAHRRLDKELDAMCHVIDGKDAIVDFDQALDTLFDMGTALNNAARCGRVTPAWVEAQRRRAEIVCRALLAALATQRRRAAELDATARQAVRTSMGCCLPLEDA